MTIADKMWGALARLCYAEGPQDRAKVADELIDIVKEVERLEQHHAALLGACEAAYRWMHGVWGQSEMVMGIERHPIRLLMLRLEAALRGDGGGCHGQ